MFFDFQLVVWTCLEKYEIPNGENKIVPKHQPAIFLWLK